MVQPSSNLNSFTYKGVRKYQAIENKSSIALISLLHWETISILDANQGRIPLAKCNRKIGLPLLQWEAAQRQLASRCRKQPSKHCSAHRAMDLEITATVLAEGIFYQTWFPPFLVKEIHSARLQQVQQGIPNSTTEGLVWPSFLPVHTLTAEDGTSTSISATQVRDVDRDPSSWLWPGPGTAIGSIWEGKEKKKQRKIKNPRYIKKRSAEPS